MAVSGAVASTVVGPDLCGPPLPGFASAPAESARQASKVAAISAAGHRQERAKELDGIVLPELRSVGLLWSPFRRLRGAEGDDVTVLDECPRDLCPQAEAPSFHEH
jgi:hypothetical protein